MNCKNANIKLCPICNGFFGLPLSSSNSDKCWIEAYADNIKSYYYIKYAKINFNHKDKIKRQLLFLLSMNKDGFYSVPHISAALKFYLPNYIDWFNKMLLL